MRLDVTISARYDWSVARQLTSFPLRHWNLRNLTLQQECYLTSTRAFFRTFAGLYNAAASPASHLRSAVSLAIMLLMTSGHYFLKENFDMSYLVSFVHSTCRMDANVVFPISIVTEAKVISSNKVCVFNKLSPRMLNLYVL